MGAFLEKPKTDKETHKGEGHGIRYGVSAMQGWRMEMEDAHVCQIGLKIDQDYSFFGVFDGHAGPKVAKKCSEKLLDTVCTCYTEEKNKKEAEKNGRSRIEQAIYDGFIKLDKELREWESEDRSGTTAVVTVVTPDKIIWGNCGDSRGLLCRGGNVEFATVDHKPYNDLERQRIEKAGGTVLMQRVNGALAVSRALGDFDYKRSSELPAIDQLVSPEPEITKMSRDIDKDSFLLLACDGIFDVMSNEEVVAYVSKKLTLSEDLPAICSDLIDMCLNKNSRDNMSVILVTFPGAPKVSDDAISKAQETEKDVLRRAKQTIEKMVEVATDPLDLEDGMVLDALSKDMPDQFTIYTNPSRKDILEELAKARKNKWGDMESRDFSGPSDPADAPSVLAGRFNYNRISDPDEDAGFGHPASNLSPESDTKTCEESESASSSSIN